MGWFNLVTCCQKNLSKKPEFGPKCDFCISVIALRVDYFSDGHLLYAASVADDSRASGKSFIYDN
jgi:hypothetical protein